MLHPLFQLDSLLLGADIGDLIGVVIFILVALASMVAQFVQQRAKEQEAKKAGLPKKKAPFGEPRPAAPRPKKADPLVDEIETFLRQAQERAKPERAEPGRAKGQRIPPAAAQPQPAPRPSTLESRQPLPSRQKRRPTVAQKPTSTRPAAQPTPPVGDRVAEDLDTAHFNQRAKKLNHGTRQEKKRGKRRIKHKFDRQLGNLSQRTDGTKSQSEPSEETQGTFPATSAAGLAALLSDTDEIRRAIVLNEILQRPTHRWTS